MPNKAFFYGSYYRPTQNARQPRERVRRSCRTTRATRNEGLRQGHAHAAAVRAHQRQLPGLATGSTRATCSGEFTAPTAGQAMRPGSRSASPRPRGSSTRRSFLTFKYTHFTNLTQGRPDNIADVTISTDVGTRLDIARLDSHRPAHGPDAVAEPGRVQHVHPAAHRSVRLRRSADGVRKGGGTVGFGTQFDNDDFFRRAGQVGYNLTLGSGVIAHELHFGYQCYDDSEDLDRSSNGWGSITVPGGRLAAIPGTGQSGLLHRGVLAADRRRAFRSSTPSITRRTSS